MTPGELDAAVAGMRTRGLNHAEGRLGSFAATLAALLPVVLSQQFVDRAQRAIDDAKALRTALATPDLAGRDVDAVDGDGVDIELAPSPHAVTINVKPDLAGFARGDAPAVRIDRIEVTQTIEIDLGDGIRGNAFDASAKATITVVTTGTRNAKAGYDTTSTGKIVLDIDLSLSG